MYPYSCRNQNATVQTKVWKFHTNIKQTETPSTSIVYVREKEGQINEHKFKTKKVIKIIFP